VVVVVAAIKLVLLKVVVLVVAHNLVQVHLVLLREVLEHPDRVLVVVRGQDHPLAVVVAVVLVELVAILHQEDQVEVVMVV
jgi:hypothetical protein